MEVSFGYSVSPFETTPPPSTKQRPSQSKISGTLPQPLSPQGADELLATTRQFIDITNEATRHQQVCLNVFELILDSEAYAARRASFETDRETNSQILTALCGTLFESQYPLRILHPDTGDPAAIKMIGVCETTGVYPVLIAEGDPQNPWPLSTGDQIDFA